MQRPLQWGCFWSTVGRGDPWAKLPETRSNVQYCWQRLAIPARESKPGQWQGPSQPGSLTCCIAENITGLYITGRWLCSELALHDPRLASALAQGSSREETRKCSVLDGIALSGSKSGTHIFGSLCLSLSSKDRLICSCREQGKLGSRDSSQKLPPLTEPAVQQPV